MNIFGKNINITEDIERFVDNNFDFLEGVSLKEPKLTIVKENELVKFKLIFDIYGKMEVIEVRDDRFKRGFFKLKEKTKQKISNLSHKPQNKDSIRKMNPEAKVEDNKQVKERINSFDKPMTEEDIKEFMFENRINKILFNNLDENGCLCLMHRKKDSFILYRTDFYI